jgi:hypothetical protein
MKNKKIIALMFFTFIILGCTSVPEVRSAYSIDNNKYDVVIDRDYMDDPDEFKYAINSFVKQKGGTSYNIEKYDPNDFYITIPGETPVENLPEIRHFHAGRTVSATLPLILGTILLILMFSF